MSSILQSLGFTNCSRNFFIIYKTQLQKCSPKTGWLKSPNNNNGIKTIGMSTSTASSKEKIGAMGWLLFLMPVTAFGLGTWQVKRRAWKLQLIDELASRTASKPVDLPESVAEIDNLEYCPVIVHGTFDHTKEVLLGPRSLLSNEETSALMPGKSGVLVVTPFKLSDRDMTILVQRGWVPSDKKTPDRRPTGQIEGEVTLTGIVRLNEQRAAFVPKSQLGNKMYFFRDLETMSRELGTDPIFLDATASSTVPGGPIGGQTRVSLRNEHLSYIITWYSLSAFTGYMWYRTILKKLPLK